ncbi:hypothetical protein TNIN_273611 [Trichonephila inaurata madagascariensis]|uniref:Uncharacterized protein n=1 Tax=Trichonephila inaurata madagascariensis TaxID=2747483 RepID=A0A8X6X5L3_9ARAC|nr:hypothetical protein TNIN_273611 [Trichonephila inaurata madagascariensis]
MDSQAKDNLFPSSFSPYPLLRGTELFVHPTPSPKKCAPPFAQHPHRIFITPSERSRRKSFTLCRGFIFFWKRNGIHRWRFPPGVMDSSCSAGVKESCRKYFGVGVLVSNS